MAYLQTIMKNKAGLIGKTILLCAFILLRTVVVTAQEQKIQLSRQTLSAKEAIAEIKNQTDYIFAINHSQFDDSRTIYFPKQTLTIREALNHIVMGTNHTYQIKNKQILILTLSQKHPEVPLKEAEKKAVTVSQSPIAYQPPAGEYAPANNERFEREVQEYTSRLITPKEKPKEERIVEKEETAELNPPEHPLPHTNKSYTYLSSTQMLPQTGEEIGHLQPKRLRSQPTVGAKVNLLYGIAALAPNLALEFGLSRKLSLDLSVAWNPWKDKVEETNKMVHLIVKPELRYWLCERFNGHFFGVHPFYWDYNVSGKDIPLLFDKEYRYEGHAFGGGVSYGYHWMWNKRWAMEFNAGIGASFMKYKKFEAEECGEKLGDYKKKYFGPTAAGIKLMFMIK